MEEPRLWSLWLTGGVGWGVGRLRAFLAGTEAYLGQGSCSFLNQDPENKVQTHCRQCPIQMKEDVTP